jgi:HD-GYP domain-containing protein (c-di-GMP phosphodiesterase class II)
MKTKTDVQDLHKGMYITELDRSWLGTPFLFQGFEIHTDEELAQLRALCQYVYVLDQDTPVSPAVQRAKQQATPGSQLHYTAKRQIDDSAVTETLSRPFAHGETLRCHYPDVTPVEEELQQAVQVERGAREALYSILDDARLGRSVDTPAAKKAVGQMTESILRNPDALVWLTHLKNKHEYTALHSLRVCVLALALGRCLGYDKDKLNILGMGALLHDIGKLRVPVDILDKPGALTRKEFEIMKLHVPNGLRILENAEGISPAALEVIGRHHERYNGNGYAFGLSGDTIGEFGLISAIVDTYDAITSDRSYHLSLSAADALRIIYEGRDKAYHPWLTEQFIQCVGIFPIGSIVELSTGGIGVVITANRQRRLRPRVALILSPDKKPLAAITVVDLMTVTHDSNGKHIEIKNMLPSNTFGINPTDYIPIHH